MTGRGQQTVLREGQFVHLPLTNEFRTVTNMFRPSTNEILPLTNEFRTVTNDLRRVTNKFLPVAVEFRTGLVGFYPKGVIAW